MITPETKLLTSTEIIAIRDKMSLENLREITNKTMQRQGYVDYKGIFETMGYEYAFNGKYYKK